MFKKTRNRIMLLNMVMVSSVILVAFAAIFITSYTRVQAENQMRFELDAFRPFTMGNRSAIAHSEWSSLVDGASRFSGVSTSIQITGDTSSDAAIGILEGWVHEFTIPQHRMLPGEGISFSVFKDSDNNVFTINSFVDLSDEAIIRIREIAAEDINNMRSVSLDGRMWRVMSSPVDFVNSFELVRNGQSTVTVNAATEGISQIRFIDVTESHQMLQTLALTLAGATLVVLTGFFFISRYFAKQAVKPMEEAWEKQRRFITDASHELKTPLSVINANCGVLYSNQDEPLNEQIRWVDSISRATDRMTGLVGNLLSLASMDDTQYEIQCSTFDIGKEMTAAISEMEVIADDKGITIIKEIEPGIEIESDKEQVQNILSTLVENAVKYTPFNGVITASVKKEKRHITCAIRNSGPGIPPDELPNVFDRFYRGDPARSSDNSGYGLGLAIAKTIADKLDAKLSVESVEEEYTEFKVTFEG
jgi:signal transduction histidine kinase